MVRPKTEPGARSACPGSRTGPNGLIRRPAPGHLDVEIAGDRLEPVAQGLLVERSAARPCGCSSCTSAYRFRAAGASWLCIWRMLIRWSARQREIFATIPALSTPTAWRLKGATSPRGAVGGGLALQGAEEDGEALLPLQPLARRRQPLRDVAALGREQKEDGELAAEDRHAGVLEIAVAVVDELGEVGDDSRAGRLRWRTDANQRFMTRILPQRSVPGRSRRCELSPVFRLGWSPVRPYA